ncbi:insulinase family protein [SAR202 cluster bacterium AC-647-N09_OGT_505m]|nr:insulinase family protein [SAR202 cluster bacterium AC-647-N09_OGT_505m]
MYNKTVTDYGLRILTSHMPHTQSVSIVLYVGTGSRYETSEEAGISHFVEHMCFKGTRRRPTSQEISETIEGLGGVLNAATDRELTSYWCKVPSNHFQLALDVMADIIHEPLLDLVEVEKERRVILEELSMTYDVPSYRADLLIDEVMWPNQPLGRDVGGTRESVTNITKDMLMQYMQRQYTIPNLVVSIAGNIPHEEAVEAVDIHFRNWTSHQPSPWFPAEDGQSAPRMSLERRKTEQAHICIAFKGLSSTHPDRYALDMLNAVLGEGMSSRLFLELREKQSLVYDVHTTTSHLKDCGTFIAYAGVDPKNTRKAIQSILGELNRIKDGVLEEELHKAREYLKGRLVLRMEDSRSVAAWMGAQEILNDQLLTVEQVLARVDAITTEDVQSVANRLLVTEKLSIAIVGPFRSDKQFRECLKI